MFFAYSQSFVHTVHVFNNISLYFSSQNIPKNGLGPPKAAKQFIFRENLLYRIPFNGHKHLYTHFLISHTASGKNLSPYRPPFQQQTLNKLKTFFVTKKKKLFSYRSPTNAFKCTQQIAHVGLFS